MFELLVLGSKLQVVQRTADHRIFSVFSQYVVFCLMVGIPNSHSIFKLRPNQGIIGCLPQTRHLSFNVPLDKSKGFLSGIADMLSFEK